MVTRHILHGCLLACAWLLGALQGFAGPLTTGAEFEFYSAEMLEPGKHSIDDRERGYRERFRNSIVTKCPECHIEEAQGKFGEPEYKITLPGGWWFKLTIDPAVVEIQTKPSTVAEWKEVSGEVNYYIFETAKSLGLKTETSGHFNFGLRSAFGDSGALFMAFYVDYANHPELASGILGRDSMNAPTLAQALPEQRVALEKIIQEIQRGQLPALFEVTGAILKRVYTATSGFNTGPGSAKHYQAFSVKYAGGNPKYGDDPPGELRATRAQRNAEDFILLSELMEARIAYLAKGRVPLIYLAKSTDYFSGLALVNRFYAYVEESGLKWERYRKLLPEYLKTINPDDFVTGKFVLQSTADLSVLQAYSADILTSPFLRERFEQVISAKEALASGLGVQALTQMIKEGNLLASSQAKPAVRAVAMHILASAPWKEAALMSPGLLKPIQLALGPTETIRERMKRLLLAGTLSCHLLLTELNGAGVVH